MIRNFFCSLFFIVLVSTTQSSESIQYLSQSKKWSALLHYRANLFGAPRSEIGSPEFFLSPDGATDLTAEFAATLKAMAEPVGADANEHAQCRFPARAIWLKTVIPGTTSSWPQVICPDYLRFSHQGNIESISFIFATGYLSNPASFFGHPLIKFNLRHLQNGNSPGSLLLDTSISYGAVTPPDENTLVYAAKGLFGGYHATFTHRQFYYNNHNYGEVELRDMWEYRLKLTTEEVEHFYSHVWELIGKKFPYFFLSQNCATAAAQFLEDSLDVKIMPAYLPYALPHTLFDRLADAKRPNGESLVAAVNLIPSRQTRLITRYKYLNEPQKNAVRKIANGGNVNDTLKSLPQDQKSPAIETLFDYFSFKSLLEKNESLNKETDAMTRRDLLLERLNLPAKSSAAITDYSLRSPLDGPPPFLIRLAPIHSLQSGNGAEFQIRPSYYDFLTLDYGRPKNSEVRTFDLTFVTFNKALWLRKFDLIAVTTFNIPQTELPGDGGWAWRFSMGTENLNLACRDCDLFKIDVGLGKGFNAFDRLTLYSMLDMRGQTATLGSGQFAATPTVGALVHWLPSRIFSSELSFGYRSYLENDSANAALIKIDNRLGFSRWWDLRVSYEKHVDEWYRLALSLYL